jgi:hypothetical protein
MVPPDGGVLLSRPGQAKLRVLARASPQGPASHQAISLRHRRTAIVGSISIDCRLYSGQLQPRFSVHVM